jgi:hypothetical protein
MGTFGDLFYFRPNPKNLRSATCYWRNFGAGDRDRTGDVQFGKLNGKTTIHTWTIRKLPMSRTCGSDPAPNVPNLAFISRTVNPEFCPHLLPSLVDYASNQAKPARILSPPTNEFFSRFRSHM